MRKTGFLILFLFLLAKTSFAINPKISPGFGEQISTESAQATEGAKLLSEPRETIAEPQSPRVKGKLEAALKSQKIGNLSPMNFLKYLVRLAVDRGVSPNTIVLVFLLPLIGVLVGVLQYFVGLSGFGMFIPAMLAVAFLATGITGGLLLFGIIVLIGVITREVLRPIRLHYWPKRAIVLAITALATFGVLLTSPFLGIYDLNQVSIFPILFFILLSEEFSRAQAGKNFRTAVSLTLATLILAILGAILMSWESLQKLVLLNPELSFLFVLVFNGIVGRYSGFRLLEYKRFYSLLKRY